MSDPVSIMIQKVGEMHANAERMFELARMIIEKDAENGMKIMKMAVDMQQMSVRLAQRAVEYSKKIRAEKTSNHEATSEQSGHIEESLPSPGRQEIIDPMEGTSNQ